MPWPISPKPSRAWAAANRREILADDKLTKVFGKDKVTMFEMNKHLTRHLK
jgi:chromatin remodeling complex protein RSC6